MAYSSRGSVLIVEDEWIVARDVETELTRSGFDVAGMATRGAEAIERAAATHPDVVLMDISLEGEMDGVDAARAIISEPSPPAVVFLTAHADAVTLARIAETSSSGYLLKPFHTPQLLGVVAIAVARSRQRDAELGWRSEAAATLRRMADRLTAGTGQPVGPTALDLRNLTAQERRVVELLVSNYRTRAIAEALGLSYHTVRNHLKNIFRKLDVSSQVDLIERLRPR